MACDYEINDNRFDFERSVANVCQNMTHHFVIDPIWKIDWLPKISSLKNSVSNTYYCAANRQLYNKMIFYFDAKYKH